MRTAKLLLFFLLVCKTTESLRDKLVNLGGSVTLDCQIDVKEIYWVFQKLTDSPVPIMRTFTSDSTSSQFYDKRLKDKYSSLTSSRLFISNITIDELGIYYCAKTSPALQFSSGTRLFITEDVQDQDQTEVKNNSQCLNTQQIILYLILNIGMFIAIIVLLQIKLRVCKKTHQQYRDEELEQLYSTNDEEFSEVEFRLSRPTNNTFGKKPR